MNLHLATCLNKALKTAYPKAPGTINGRLRNVTLKIAGFERNVSQRE